MKNKSVRNTNIEVLRFMLMVLILVWHIVIHGYGFLNIGNDNFTYLGNVPLTLSVAVFVVPATYCFVFISGYYGIKFHLKKLIEIILWCVCVNIGYIMYLKYGAGTEVKIMDFVKSFFPIATNRWWFMSAYVMLYLLSPFLNAGMTYIKRKDKIILLAILFFLSFTPMLLGKYNAGSNLGGLIFIYLLGRLLREEKNLSYKCYLLSHCTAYVTLLVLLLIVFYLSCWFNLIKAQRLLMILCGYINPLIILMAVCMFFLVLKLPAYSNRWINNILSANVFIYLITECDRGGVQTDSKIVFTEYF